MLKYVLLFILGFVLGATFQKERTKTIVSYEEDLKEASGLKKKHMRILKDHRFQKAITSIMENNHQTRSPAEALSSGDQTDEPTEVDLQSSMEDFEKDLQTMTNEDKKTLIINLEEEIQLDEEAMADLEKKEECGLESIEDKSVLKDDIELKKQKLELLMSL
jgi:hypothetical protein